MQALNEKIKDIAIPYRMQRLPISDKGFPIPWFVWIDENGVADFRILGPGKIGEAYRHHKCWLCGEPLGTWMCFTVGPMCVINRVSAEPPEHLECAEYAVKACPFLTNPKMRRNDNDMPENHRELPGVMVKRNPGVTAIFVTRSFQAFRADRTGVLFRMGEPERVQWYAHGRKATREEVQQSISTGLPALEDMAVKEGKEAQQELYASITKAQPWLPAA
jgi:hypothetical protein